VPAEPRLVSLVPSLTAALDDLGLGRTIVGRTAWCPPGAAATRVVGGTKDPDLEAIRELAPDIVLAVREENRREDVEALLAAGLSVEVFEPRTVEDAAPLARELGRLGGDRAAGEQMADEIAAAVEAVRGLPLVPVPTAYLVWRKGLRQNNFAGQRASMRPSSKARGRANPLGLANPSNAAGRDAAALESRSYSGADPKQYLAAGPATWIGDVLSVAGFPPVVPAGPERSP